MFVTLRGLPILSYYEQLEKSESAEKAFVILEEFCEMYENEEEVQRELYTMLVGAVSSQDIRESNERSDLFSLYECLSVAVKAIYVIDRDRKKNKEEQKKE